MLLSLRLLRHSLNLELIQPACLAMSPGEPPVSASTALGLQSSATVSVLVRVTIAAMKRHDPKQHGKKRVYFTHRSISQSLIKSSEGGLERWLKG